MSRSLTRDGLVASAPPVVASASPRTRVSMRSAVGTLTGRAIRAGVREGDLVFAIVSPLAFFVCFYVPLHHRFSTVGVDYAQYLTPLIVIQAGLFTGIVAAENAARDHAAGVRSRLMSCPIPRVAPLVARVLAAMSRNLVSLVVAVAIGTIFGFRFESVGGGIGFIVMACVFALGIVMICDAVGFVLPHPEGVAAVLMVPQLILVMASTGVIPASGFPHWIAPVVRNQPVSVFADAMRGAAGGGSVGAMAVVIWSVGMVAVGAVCIVAAGRKQLGR